MDEYNQALFEQYAQIFVAAEILERWTTLAPDDREQVVSKAWDDYYDWLGDQ